MFSMNPENLQRAQQAVTGVAQQAAVAVVQQAVTGAAQQAIGAVTQQAMAAVTQHAATPSAQNVMNKAGAMVFQGVISGLETCDKEGIGKAVRATVTAVAKEVNVVEVTRKAAANASLVVDTIPSSLAMEAGRKFSSLSTNFVKQIDVADTSKHIVKQASHFVKDAAPLATAVVAGGVLAFGAFCGAHYVYKAAVHNIGKPSLGTWESSPGVYQNYIQPLLPGRGDVRTPRSPVFNAEIQQKMNEIEASFLGLAKDGKPFQHLLVYGPPGTGKTMVSAKIIRDVIAARNGKVNCIRMSGGDFEQFMGRQEHITELHKLFNTMNRSSYPTILVIDEFEALGGDRQHHLRQELISLQDAFLARTGTETRKFMLITATNLVESLDTAVIDRFAHKICVPLPSEEQRAQIISDGLNEYFTRTEINSLFSVPKIREIAKKTEGFSGRKLLEMISKIDSMRYVYPQLTQEIVDRKVQQSVDEENTVKQLRRQAHERTNLSVPPSPNSSGPVASNGSAESSSSAGDQEGCERRPNRFDPSDD